MTIKLTFNETEKLEEKGFVYAIRESGVYLIELIENRYTIQFFPVHSKVILTYQKKIGV